MRAVVHPSHIGTGESPLPQYKPPPSKSHFQRLCAAALLRRGVTRIANPGRSEDDAAALRIIQELGAEVNHTEAHLEVRSSGRVVPRAGVIHCGESGLSARLFSAIAALAETSVVVQGEGSLLTRPMHGIIQALRMLGVSVESSDGMMPLSIRGPLQPQNLTVDGKESSQMISGLLFALAASATRQVRLSATELVSRPYVQMSCDVLRDFGWDVSFDGVSNCIIEPGVRAVPSVIYETDADWSSAAPIAVAAAISGDIDMDAAPMDNQADESILNILEAAGAGVLEIDGMYWIARRPLRAFTADCTHSPDLVPILTILATACEGQSRISGLHRLTHKESDRTKTTSALLTALAIDHRIENDAFVITGPQTPRSATVSGHNDHRIVMLAAIAALRADGPVTIEGAEAVGKSYPDFFMDLQKLGVQVDLVP